METPGGAPDDLDRLITESSALFARLRELLEQAQANKGSGVRPELIAETDEASKAIAAKLAELRAVLSGPGTVERAGE